MRSLNLGRLAVVLAAASLLLGLAARGFAASPLKMSFITHAAFFSAESKQPKTLDPQVFVHDPRR